MFRPASHPAWPGGTVTGSGPGSCGLFLLVPDEHRKDGEASCDSSDYGWIHGILRGWGAGASRPRLRFRSCRRDASPAGGICTAAGSAEGSFAASQDRSGATESRVEGPAIEGGRWHLLCIGKGGCVPPGLINGVGLLLLQRDNQADDSATQFECRDKPRHGVHLPSVASCRSFLICKFAWIVQCRVPGAAVRRVFERQIVKDGLQPASLRHHAKRRLAGVVLMASRSRSP